MARACPGNIRPQVPAAGGKQSLPVHPEFTVPQSGSDALEQSLNRLRDHLCLRVPEGPRLQRTVPQVQGHVANGVPVAPLHLLRRISAKTFSNEAMSSLVELPKLGRQIR
jgi:hypothetical protein